jgi:RNA polymerase sigma factor (sigma-70 family)
MGTVAIAAKTDAQLVEASRRGELEAFGHLVERYQDLVCAVGFSATGDRVLGEDVAQDTFVAAWQQLDRVRDVMRIGPWLCAIARNLGRKARRRTRREQLDDGDSDRAVAVGPSAFEQLASRDAERVVREALARVPDSYREVLVLYYREERSVRDVATALGITEDAVMQRLSRGRRHLADSVTSLVERSLRSDATSRPRRDLVAAVLAAIAVLAIPPRVDASPAAKGSTMLKLALAATALAAAGTTAYLVHGHGSDDGAASELATTAARPATLLHFGPGAARTASVGHTAPRHETAARRAAVDDLGWLPANADVVVGVDMTRIQTSVLWQTFVEPAVEHASGLDEFVKACGFDPLASLSLVTVGMSGLGNDAQLAGTIVVHGFDKAKAMACLTNYAVPQTGAKVTVDGDVVLLNSPDGTGAAIGLTFVDDTTALVVVGAAGATKAGIEQVAAGHGALASSPQFSDLFADIDSDDPLWVVLGPSAPMFDDVNNAIGSATSIRVQAAYGSLDVTSSLTIQAGLRLASPDQVTQLVGIINTQVAALVGSNGSAGLAAYFDQLDVTADGNDVIMSMSATAPQLMGLFAAGSVQASATPAGSNGPGTFSVGASL